MKPPAPNPRHHADPKLSISMQNYSGIDYDDIPDLDFPSADSRLPSIKPAEEFRAMDRASALREVPNLNKFQQRLSEVCDRDDYSLEHAALLLEQEGIGLDLTLCGPAMLIVNIPTYLAPMLAQLAGSAPEIVNWPTLDLKDSKTLMLWTVTDTHGRMHSIALPAGLMGTLSNSYNVDGKFSWMEFIFCCADQVAFSKVWIDESFISEAQAAGMSGLRHCDYSDAEQTQANAATAAAGSPTPWLGNPWVNDDGSVLTEIAVWRNTDLVRLSGDGSEEFVRVDVPSVEARVLTRAAAAEFLPDVEHYQSRLAAACARTGCNSETAAYLVEWAESGKNAPYGPGPILIANLPAHMAPLLSKFADISISMQDYPALDLNGGATLVTWSVQAHGRCFHTVAIDAALLPILASPFEYSAPYVRVAFCCGDSVVYGRYLIYNEYMPHAYSAGVSDLHYNSQAELAAANINASEAGSPTPWYGKPWEVRADGSTLTQLVVLKDRDEASGTGELQSVELEEYMPSVKPTVGVQVVDHARASEKLPEFYGHQFRLFNACIDSDANPRASALFACKANWSEPIASPSANPVLIANLPPYLSPLLEKLAGKIPQTITKPSLDLRECATLLTWNVHDENGQLHTVAVDVGILWILRGRKSTDDNLRYFSIAFCCEDKVAFSGLWINAADFREAETTVDGSTQYGNFESEEQEAGAARTAAAGSTEPWLGQPWQDDDGSTFTQLVLFTEDSSDGHVLKY